eukprot:2025065-Pleurochrysis_carterae.AAC.1
MDCASFGFKMTARRVLGLEGSSELVGAGCGIADADHTGCSVDCTCCADGGGGCGGGSDGGGGSKCGTVDSIRVEVSTDDLVGLAAYVLVMSNPSNLLASLKLVEEFLPESLALGREGYALTTMQAGPRTHARTHSRTSTSTSTPTPSASCLIASSHYCSCSVILACSPSDLPSPSFFRYLCPPSEPPRSSQSARFHCLLNRSAPKWLVLHITAFAFTPFLPCCSLSTLLFPFHPASLPSLAFSPSHTWQVSSLLETCGSTLVCRISKLQVAMQVALEMGAASQTQPVDDDLNALPPSALAVAQGSEFSIFDLGDCPYGLGSEMHRDGNGVALRRGDHILRFQGSSTVSLARHGIYVGGAGERQARER